MSNYIIHNGTFISEDELYHYGVKGMRWGVRKDKQGTSGYSLSSRYQTAKTNYREAFKTYSKSYIKANKYAALHPFSQWGKNKEQNDRLWDTAKKDAKRLKKANASLESIRKERKKALKKTYKQLRKRNTLGDKLMYDSATRKRAAKYVIDNNMSMDEATEKAKNVALRNTTVFLATYGVI